MSAMRGAAAIRGWFLGAMLAGAAARPAAAQAPAPGPSDGPRVWAVVAGVERYQDSASFPRCRGAARDAGNLARWLIDVAGWAPEHVLLLTDAGPESIGLDVPARRPEHRIPTRENLEWGVREWLPSKAKPGDVLVVFFAGQAVGLVPGEDRRPGSPDPDYLIPMDARGADVERTAWRPGPAIEPMAARGDYSIVLLLDTSPAGRGQFPRPLGAPARVAPAERMLRGLVRWPGVTAWLAAGDRPSGQVDEDGTGRFTGALLASLGGRRRPSNLLECLDRLRREPSLAAQRFRVSGGFRADLTLWPAGARPRPPRMEPVLQRGHADRVTAVSFTADGARLYSASQDSTVRIWSARDARLDRVLPAALNGVWGLAESADGRMLAAGGGEGEVFIYDLDRGLERSFTGGVRHRSPVESVAFLAERPDETPAQPAPGPATAPPPRRVVSLDGRGLCIVWDASKQALRQLSTPGEGAARLLAAARRPGPAAFCLVTPAVGGGEAVEAFGPAGERLATLPKSSARITALAIADDGSRVQVGRDDGMAVEYELPGGAKRAEWKLDGPIGLIREAPLWLVAATERDLHVLLRGEEGGRLGAALAVGGEVGRVALSSDGRRIAAGDRVRGVVKVWELSDDGADAAPIAIDRDGDRRALSLGFSPGGETLVAGDGDGGIRFWEIPAGKARPGIAAGRGRVKHIAVSPDQKALLEVNDDGVALVWEFGEGRGPRRVPGSGGFRPTGGFLPMKQGGDLALITGDGDVVLHDRATLARRPVDFERPLDKSGRRFTSWRFRTLAVDHEGLRIAAGSGNGPLACVWRVSDGRLAATIREHRAGINAVAFSRAGTSLATASEDGAVKVWSLAGDKPRLVREINDGGEAPAPATAAALSPRDESAIVIGRQDGRLSLLKPGAAGAVDVEAGLGKSMVHSVAFSDDGRYVAAGGDGPQVVLFDQARPSELLGFDARPNHSERINAVAFWPDGKILATASDDTTIRLWKLPDRVLLGTLASSSDGLDWVVYTPSGVFDASPEGERRVSWRPAEPAGGADVVARLDQLRAQRHVFDLAERLSLAEVAPAPAELPPGRPPHIEIEPVAAAAPSTREVELAIRVSDADAEGLRLYQNGVPIAGELKIEGGTARASVKLVGGSNRFYALAGKPGCIDARSNSLDLAYEGRTEGRTQILAIGVSEYTSQALRYAAADAESIAETLGRQAIGGPSPAGAEPIILLDRDVTRKSVGDAFEELHTRVRGRPEDKVVVFLAGHTDVREGYFCLLLPTARMPEEPPGAPGNQLVALRGGRPAAPGAANQPAPDVDPTLLPYGLIHGNLRFLDALQRLVIVDACQAGAIFDDPVVRRRRNRSVRILAEEGAYQSRTSYILAARRGERAGEAEILKHGLLTYALLRGIGRQGIGPEPDLPFFKDYPTADLNRDGWVETGELKQYADVTVPKLAQTFPELVLRGARGTPNDSVARSAEQSFSFPLVETASP